MMVSGCYRTELWFFFFNSSSSVRKSFVLKLLHENEKLERTCNVLQLERSSRCEVQTRSFGVDFGNGHAPDSLDWDIGTGRQRHLMDWINPHVLCTFYYIYKLSFNPDSFSWLRSMCFVIQRCERIHTEMAAVSTYKPCFTFSDPVLLPP